MTTGDVIGETAAELAVSKTSDGVDARRTRLGLQHTDTHTDTPD